MDLEPRSTNLNRLIIIIDLETEIKRHNHDVSQGPNQRVCYQNVCTACRKSGPFAPHQVRARNLRYIVQNTVVCARIWLARWKCRNCGKTFTDYPFFRLAL